MRGGEEDTSNGEGHIYRDTLGQVDSELLHHASGKLAGMNMRRSLAHGLPSSQLVQ